MLWIILILSGVLKLWLAVSLDSSPPVLDERDYLQLAQGLVDQGRYAGAFRPPLYPAYMAMMISWGWGTLGIRIGQVLMSTVSAVLAYRIARRMLGTPSARIAAGLLAFDPVLVMFTHRLWSETLFIVLLLAALDILSASSATRKWWPWLAAGFLFGLAGLTRPVILTFVPLLLPWAILQMRRREPFPVEECRGGGRIGAGDPVTSQQAGTPRAGGPARRDSREAHGLACGPRNALRTGGLRFIILVVGCAAVVAPWTIRNALAHHALIVVDTNGPFNLLVGSQSEAAFVDKDSFWSQRFGLVGGRPYQAVARHDASAAQRMAMQQTWENVHRTPRLFAQKCLWEASRLWTLDSFLLRHLRNGWYGSATAPWLTVVLTLVAIGFFIMLGLASFVGLATEPPSPFRGLAFLLIVHATILFGITYSLSRYCLPLHAVLAVPAAGLLSSPRCRLSRLRSAGFRSHRVLLLAVVVAVLGWQWARDLPLVRDMINNSGAGHLFQMERMAPPG